MRLQDRVAIVTGGGSGIGTAYARRFVAEGAKVMIADIGEEQGRRAAEELSNDGDVEFVRTDIADPASAQAAVDATLEHFGHVDILVNNAAIYGDYNGGDNSLEYLRQVFDVNVHGQWVMAKAVAPLLVQQRWGRIVNVASIAAYLHQLGAMADPDNFELSSFAYMQSKWGVLGLTRHMAGQLGQFNVTVNCIAPGPFLTDLPGKLLNDEQKKHFASRTAFGRWGKPEEIVGPALMLASDAGSYVTGSTLLVDGGNMARTL